MYQSWTLEALEAKLERMELAGLEDSEEYLTINQIANEKAEARLAVLEQHKQEDKAKLLRKNQILAAIEAGDSELAIRLGGDEFIKDYHVYQSSGKWVVSSSVAQDNNNSYWEFETDIKANQKLNQLLYYRIYDNYHRDRK